MMRARPFHFKASDADLVELGRRLRDVRWPGDFGNDGGRYGLEQSWLSHAITYWRDRYDWRATEAEMNRLPNFQVEIEGVPLHFVHIRSGRAGAIPLILSHGWPWSFWDWKEVIAALCADGGQPAFDLVVPSLPGFGFSTPLRTTGVNVRAIGRLWRTLMRDVLGYRRFAAAGGDYGSAISAELGHAFPDDVIGVHLTLPLFPGLPLGTLTDMQFAGEERWMAEQVATARPTIASHLAVQINDPQTLAYALADTPTGLAAWLWERRLAWSDPAVDSVARSPDFLCALATLYWLTNSIGSSMRLYAEQFRLAEWTSLTGRPRAVDVPTGFAFGPKELLMCPRAVAETLCDLRRWTVLPRGGHFIAAEMPELLAAEYRTFFSTLG